MRFTTIASALLAACASCRVNIVDPTFSSAVAEDRGTFVADANGTSLLVWGETSGLLYHTGSYGIPRLFSFDVATGTSAIVDEQQEGTYDELAAAPDGAALYYALSGRTSAAIYAALSSDERRVLISNRVGRGFVDEGLRHMVVSADSKFLYFVTDGDSLLEYNAITKATRLIRAQGCRQIGPFSPDGREIICAATGSGYTRVTLANGSNSSITLRLDVGDRPQLFYWGAGGLRVFFRRFLEYYILDAQTNVVTRVISESGSLQSGFGDKFAWSRDGAMIAAWSWRCVRSTGLLSCDSQSTLQLLTLASLTSRNIAIVSARDLSAASLSPDGKRVAYQADNSIYIKTLP